MGRAACTAPLPAASDPSFLPFRPAHAGPTATREDHDAKSDEAAEALLKAAFRRALREALRVDRRRIADYLARHPVRRLHLGCGTHVLPGWLNTDLRPAARGVVRLDATRRYPLPDGSVDRIYAEHVIEHLSYRQGQAMLSECLRVLKPGGRLRVATPDVHFLLGLFGARSALQNRYLEWATENFLPDAPGVHPVFVVNNFYRDWGHQLIYDEETLRAALERAGFVDLQRLPLGESPDPELRGLENAGRMPEGMLELETLVLEAVRPLR